VVVTVVALGKDGSGGEGSALRDGGRELCGLDV